MPATARYHLVELLRQDDGWSEIQELSARARTAADEIRSEGKQVRFVRSIFEPESGSCFLLFEAPSASEACLAAARADLAVESTVVTTIPPTGGDPC